MTWSAFTVGCILLSEAIAWHWDLTGEAISLLSVRTSECFKDASQPPLQLNIWIRGLRQVNCWLSTQRDMRTSYYICFYDVQKYPFLTLIFS